MNNMRIKLVQFLLNGFSLEWKCQPILLVKRPCETWTENDFERKMRLLFWRMRSDKYKVEFILRCVPHNLVERVGYTIKVLL